MISHFYLKIDNVKNKFNQKDYESEKIDDFELEIQRKERLLNNEFWNIVKEITHFSIFLVFLFVVSYANITANSIYFNKLFQNTFVYVQNNQEIGLNNVKTKKLIEFFSFIK